MEVWLKRKVKKKSFRTFTGENGKEEKTEFIYKLPFSNHFDFRHIVDDHNKLRHKIPSLEETWVTNRWPVRVFQYLLACTEVNIFLAMRFFVWQPDSCMKFHDFRSKLAWELINNEYLKKAEEDERKKRAKRRGTEHELARAPPHAKKWTGQKWDCSAKQKYQQYVCRGVGCTKPVRTYCVCSIGHWLCQSCFFSHVINLDN